MSRLRRIAAWFALSAIAFNAVGPTAALAQAAGTGSVVLVCTAMGAKAVVLDRDGNPQPEAPSAKPHCPLCTTPPTPFIPGGDRSIVVQASDAVAPLALPVSDGLAGRDTCVIPPAHAPPANC